MAGGQGVVFNFDELRGGDACGKFEAYPCRPESKAHGQKTRNHSSALAVLCKLTLRGGLNGVVRFLTLV
ncbi:unnamed protein product, partial [Ectocarpus sp. 13 AM-2016]